MTVIVDMLNTVEYRFYKSHLVHETTIRKRLNKYGLFGRRTPPKKTMAGQLRIAKLRMTKPMWRYLDDENQTQAYQHKHLLLRHGGGWVSVWACLSATAPEHLTVTEST